MIKQYSLTCAFAVMLQMAVAPGVTAAPGAGARAALFARTGGIPATTESRFIALINAERTSRDETPLVIDPYLQAAAREHSREMSDLHYFDHFSPTPGMTTPTDRYARQLRTASLAMPNAYLIGENIYYSSVFDVRYGVDYGHQSLMHSPPHRANILDPRFSKIGVGIYTDSRGQVWVTQMFLGG